jgi:hypothetical protein
LQESEPIMRHLSLKAASKLVLGVVPNALVIVLAATDISGIPRLALLVVGIGSLAGYVALVVVPAFRSSQRRGNAE